MYCGFCGSFIPDGQSFCQNCGSKATPGTEQVAANPTPVVSQPINVQPALNQQVSPAPNTTARKNELARTGMVLGILSAALCWIPYLGFLFAIAGLVLSIIGVTRKNTVGKGKAIAGIILASFGLIIGAGITSSLSKSLKTKSSQPSESAIVSVSESSQTSNDSEVSTSTTVEETTNGETTIPATEETTELTTTTEESVVAVPTEKPKPTSTNTPTPKPTNTPKPTAAPDPKKELEAFKKTTTPLDYKAIARNPEKYVGKNFRCAVYVSSARTGGLLSGYQKYYITYMTDVGKARKYRKEKWTKDFSNAGFMACDTNKCVWLMDNRKTSDSNYVKILEGDVLYVYGTFNGLTTSKNSLTGETGEEVSLEIKYVELVKK